MNAENWQNCQTVAAQLTVSLNEPVRAVANDLSKCWLSIDSNHIWVFKYYDELYFTCPKGTKQGGNLKLRRSMLLTNLCVKI